MNEGPAKQKSSPALALGLAFLPAAMALAITTARITGPVQLFFGAGAISALCCFVASFMLFSRGNAIAILAGLLFLLLNGFIAFLFGCAVLFAG